MISGSGKISITPNDAQGVQSRSMRQSRSFDGHWLSPPLIDPLVGRLSLSHRSRHFPTLTHSSSKVVASLQPVQSNLSLILKETSISHGFYSTVPILTEFSKPITTCSQPTMNNRSGEQLLSPAGGGAPAGKRASAIMQPGAGMAAVLAGLDDDDYDSEDDAPPAAGPPAPAPGAVNNHRPYVGGFAAAAFEAARASATATQAKKEEKKKKTSSSSSRRPA